MDFTYGSTNGFTCPFQITRHAAVIPKEEEHQSGLTASGSAAEENEKLGMKTLI